MRNLRRQLGDVAHILFYGTLRSREKQHAALGLRGALTPLGKRRISGTLYDLGDYPGLVLGAGSTVAELHRIDDAAILKRLDRFEGYDPGDPAGSLFVRTIVRVPRFPSSGAGLDAWVYVFNRSVEGRRAIERW